ncbi:MAG: DEAD/DEAH box helicase [Candidatus Ancillula sp.]|jgi:ATP-dependent RNA helicase DeaD|nr:DEAD/DEAH box helicase [Candidatus Ancillula sp.]
MTKENIGFESLDLEPKLLESIKKLGYQKPSEIQIQTIPLLLQGRDVVGIAQTGTGKTAAFGLPLVQKIGLTSKQKKIKALVLAPTRELAQQNGKALKSFDEDLKVAVIYGGAPYPAQLKQLKDGAEAVVATPGRLIDMLKRKALELDQLQTIVLDEADEMLKMGFQEDIEKIFELAHSENNQPQVALFSATMPAAIKKITKSYMTDPLWIQVSSPVSTGDNITQEYVFVQGRGKTSAAARFIHLLQSQSALASAIVFTQTKASAEIVGVELTSLGLRAATISGDVPQKERERIVERMRSGKIQVLVATDVAARGLDIDSIELVINYDLPRETEYYIHRIGRTGRAGRDGRAISLVSPKQKGKLRQIEKLTGKKIKEIDVPSLDLIRAIQAKDVLGKATNRKEIGKLKFYKAAVLESLQELDNEKELIDFVSALVALSVGDSGKEPKKIEEQKSFEEKDSYSKKPNRGRRRDFKGKRSERGKSGSGKRYSERDSSRKNSKSDKRSNSKRKDSKNKYKKKKNR